MKLPYGLVRLQSLRLAEQDIRETILEGRGVIRSHRDARGDDRCWLDDYLVHEMLEDWGPHPIKLPENAFEICTCFYRLRRSETADPMPKDAILDPAHWDDDLIGRTSIELLQILFGLQQAINKHRSIPVRMRTIEDDRELYSILPEKIPADFRLPPEEEFLGEEKAPEAGCPAFIRSHHDCLGICNLHAWGPCIPQSNRTT
jgi:hypothetical protein